MNKKAILSLFSAIILWSITYPIIKIGVGFVDPLLLSFLRVLTAAIFFVIVVVMRGSGRDLIEILKDSIARIIVVSSSGIFFYQLTQNYGIKFTLASVAGAITGAYPVVGLIMAAVLLKESITTKKVVGVLVGLAGIMIIFFGGQDLSVILKTRCFFGNILMLLNIICFGIFSIYSKVLTQKYSPLKVTTVIHIFGALLLLPIVLITQDISMISKLTLSSWLIVVFLGVFCSGIAYLFWIYGLKWIEVSKASVFIYLLPIGSISFSVLLLGENVTKYLMSGTGLILIGIFLVESNPLKRRGNKI